MLGSTVRFSGFAGRDNEVALVRERYREAAGGHANVLLIGGEAGIGKSRLVDETLRILRLDGALGAVSFCFEHMQTPLGALADAFRELSSAWSELLLDAPALYAAVSCIVPELQRADVDAFSSSDVRGLFAALVEALRRFSQAQPLVLVVEDVHCADLTMLEWLQFLAGKLSLEQQHAPLRMLFVVTYRSDELHRSHPLTTVIAKLRRSRSIHPLELMPMPRRDLRSLAVQALGTQALGPGVLDEIVTLSEGNPLYCEELLRHALEETTRGVRSRTLPVSIQTAVIDRFGQLSESDRSILSHASVIGRRFDAQTLARIGNRSAGDVAATLRHARDLQLVIEVERAPGYYEFRHALMREALYSDLLATESRGLHERVAADIEASPGGRDRVTELAYHSWSSGNAANATKYNELAGDEAMAAFASADAARAYTRALEFVLSDPAHRAELNAKLGEALALADEKQRAQRAFEAAIAHFETVGDWERVARLALRRGGIVSWEDSRDALRWFTRALEIMRERPQHPLYFAALVHAACARFDESDPLYKDLFLLAEDFAGNADPSDRARFLSLRAWLQYERGDVEQSLAGFQSAIDAKADIGLRWALANAALGFGAFELAHSVLDAAISKTRQRSLPGEESQGHLHLAGLAFCRGRLEQARAELEQSIHLAAEPARILFTVAPDAIVLGLVLGDDELVRRFDDPAYLEGAFAPGARSRVAGAAASYAQLFAQRGDLSAARAVLSRAMSALEAFPRPWFWLEVARFGDLDEARRLRDRLSAWCWHPANRAGKAILALFEAHTNARTKGDAATPAAMAASLFAELDAPYYEAQSLELCRKNADALVLYERIGAAGETRRLRTAQVLSEPRRRRGSDELTTRESEVAELVAAGKTNRIIAQTLVLSERTVENHIASIFGKLGVRSRTELAARLRERRESALNG